MLVTFTIPDSLLINFYDTKIAQEIFTQLENRFSKSTTPSPTLSTPTQESRQKRDTSNRERRRKVERDRERSGEDQPTDRSVEKRNRRGKRAAERTGEGEAAVRRPGEEALDVATASISLTVKLSSQKVDDDGDVEVHCTSVVPQNLNATRQAASDAAADPATSNTKGARPPEPAGTSHELRDKPHEGAAAATGPGKEAMDQMASGVSLVKPTSSHMSNGSGDVEVHRMSVMSQQPLANNWSTGEAAADATNPDVTSAGPTGPAGAPCRPAEGEPPSMPLEGGRGASGQMTSGHAEHPEQAQPDSSGRAHSGSAANSSANSHSARAKGPSAHAQNDARPSMHTNPQHNANAGVRDGVRTEQRDGVQSKGEWRREGEENLPEVPALHPNSPAPHARKRKQPEHAHGTPDTIEVEPGSANADDMNSTRTGQHCSANAHSESGSARAEQSLKRPVEPINPPRRRGRLKTQAARSCRACAYEETRTRPCWDHTGSIGLVGCIGYALGMLGEHPRASRPKAEG
ncbi:hypothetical protein BU15DRAFT_83152 [Melanogaster broomeanus]|nr:hypothetical protein BU15DRAFT_83152 [Melanogaster broomeanus]